MNITRKSMLSGKESTRDIDINVGQLQRWKNGEHIQNVVPHLSPDDREFIMTGITKEEWDSMVPGGDE